jgi:hypothetical protein
MRRKLPTENYNQLGNLLERYKKHFKPPQASVEKVCISVIKDITGMPLGAHQITYTVHSRTVTIKAPSLIKSELKTHHTAILLELEKRLGLGGAPTTII